MLHWYHSCRLSPQIRKKVMSRNSVSSPPFVVPLPRLYRAYLTYRHQTVYNPSTRKLQPLTPFPPSFINLVTLDETPPSSPNLDFLGPIYDDRVAREVAHGRTNPRTRLPYLTPSTGQESIKRRRTDAEDRNSEGHGWDGVEPHDDIANGNNPAR